MDNIKIGKLKSYEVVQNEVKLQFEEQVASIFVMKDDIIRFFVPFFRAEDCSKAVENVETEACDFSVALIESSDIEKGIEIKTSKLNIKVKDDFKVDIYNALGELICADYKGNQTGLVKRSADYKLAEAEGHEMGAAAQYKVCVKKEMAPNTYFYGVGEHTGHLNKKCTHLVNWNTDNPSPHNETFDRLYKSVPFLITMVDGKAYGIFFDNHFETHFDLGKDSTEYYYFAAVEGNLDYYFIGGPEVKTVLEGYTSLTGRMPLPALWTLGYHQSRWSYDNKERLMEIAKSFREKDIPCDTIHLDIDYMDNYKVFTWNDERFPDAKEILEALKQMGYKIVTIIDPGVKAEAGYEVYEEGLEKGYFAKDTEGNVYHNEVWPGDSVFPDFTNRQTRSWWADLQKKMMDTGVSGIWNDMNEPASFKGPLPDDVMFNEDGMPVMHKEVHNVYGHLMSKATYEGIKKHTQRRPFVITRACYAGSQKYTTIWTGDNQSTWEHLKMSLPMLMNLGLSGMSFCGTDVGGFGFDCTGELLSRWVQVGTFTPLFRNHACMGTRDQEPWAFDEQTEAINRKYIKLRYQFMPYLYDMMWQASKTGAPLIRPLLFNYQEDTKTYEINDEFLCGDKLLVAPVVTQGTYARAVYLPEGNNWIDYWDGKEYAGGTYIVKEAPLDTCPLFVKANGIFVSGAAQNYIGECEAEKTIEVYLGAKPGCDTYRTYEDQGDGFEYQDDKFNLYEIHLDHKESQVELTVKALHKGMDTLAKVKLNVQGNFANKPVVVNGQVIANPSYVDITDLI